MAYRGYTDMTNPLNSKDFEARFACYGGFTDLEMLLLSGVTLQGLQFIVFNRYKRWPIPSTKKMAVDLPKNS